MDKNSQLSKNDLLALALCTVDPTNPLIRSLNPKATRKTKATLPEARRFLLDAVHTPEDRQTLAASLGCTYAEVTQWAIRADLMRLPNVSAEVARKLADAGVLGVKDLYRKVNGQRESESGAASLTPTVNLEKLCEAAPNLEELGKAAAKLDPKIISETSVVLVVKGAGLQKADETLDLFVNNFWPAVKHLDPTATICKRHDIFPKDYRTSTRDDKPLNHVTEIVSGERRICLKEPFWETVLNPADPLDTVMKEWRLAAYSFTRSVYKFWHVPYKHRQDLKDDKEHLKEYEKHNIRRYYVTFVQVYFSMLLHLALTLFIPVSPPFWSFPTIENILRSLGANLPLTPTVGTLLLASFVAALLVSILPAYLYDKRIKIIKTHAVNLPAVSDWLMLLLMLAFLVSPATYLLWLMVGVALLLALLSARAAFWSYRAVHNTDSFVDHYYSIIGRDEIFKWDNREPLLGLRRFYIILYRYLVAMLLPITVIALTIASVLKWSRIFEGAGEQIEKWLQDQLSGRLGDVVIYATDSAQAQSVRSVVACDIKFFCDRDDVSHLHVFAHSLGTPVTYETLFVHLPDKYRGNDSKIQTYVTIGSVLSFYNQINLILDPIYQPRFPAPPYPPYKSDASPKPVECPLFGPNFKWMNFWNLTDPITEFYGLDEYNLVIEAPAINEFDDRTKEPKRINLDVSLEGTKRSRVSPTNIKTRAELDGHGEYWHNMEQVQMPFARRVLGQLRPPECDKEKEWKGKKFRSKQWGHLQYVFFGWLVATAVFITFLIVFVCLGGLIANYIQVSPAEIIGSVKEFIPEWIRGVLSPWRDLVDTITSYYWNQLLAAASVLLPPTILVVLLARLINFRRDLFLRNRIP